MPIMSVNWRWRRAAQALLWAVTAGWAAFVLLRLFGLEFAWPVVAVLAYTPYVTVASLLPLAGAVALRSWRIVAAIAACALVLVVMVVPRALPGAQPDAEGPALRVMAVNMYGGGGDPADVLALVRRYQVDVLAVLELTEPVADALADEGIDALLPHQEVRAGDSVEGSGVYSRFPVDAAPELESVSRFEMPAVRLQPPGAEPVELMAVHPVPPVSGQVPSWRHELGALPPATPEVVRVLAGDFNATLDHAPLRRLISTGYTDAADAVGGGLTGTWRYQGRIGPMVPPAQIDRVLVDSRVAVDGLSVHHIPGSDHRAVIAELTLPTAS